MDAVLDETVAGVGEEFDGVQVIEDHHGLENVQLEIALRAGEADGGVIAHDLHGDHGEGFGLSGIYLARHNRRPGLVFRKREFAEAAARAGSEPANIIGDFEERSSKRLQCSRGEDDFVVSGERGEFIGMGTERKAGEFSNLACGFSSEFGMRVEASADGGAADGEIVEAIESDGDSSTVTIEKIHIAGKFLADS